MNEKKVDIVNHIIQLITKDFVDVSYVHKYKKRKLIQRNSCDTDTFPKSGKNFVGWYPRWSPKKYERALVKRIFP